MKKKIIILFLLILIFLSGCEQRKVHSKQFMYMDTVFQFSIYDTLDDEALEYFNHINDLLKRYHNLTYRYENSNIFDTDNTKGIYYINNHLNETIIIDDDLNELFKFIFDNDNEYFNILVGSLSNLYHDLYINAEVDNLPIIGNYNFNIDDIEYSYINKTIKLKDNMSLDLGGISKGYVIDIIRNYLDSYNLKYTINGGSSSIYTNIGNPLRKNNEFIIGLKDPNNTSNVFMSISAPIGKTATVSGDYQKYFIYNNRIYSHILDINTKEPVNTDIRSITIFTESSTIGDILSTTLFSMGSINAKEYMENNNIKGIIYKNDNTIINLYN